MNLLETKKLEIYKSRIGLMTSDQALELALEAEQFAKDCGPFDVAFGYMKHQQRTFEEYALLLEKETRVTTLNS